MTDPITVVAELVATADIEVTRPQPPQPDPDRDGSDPQ